MKMIDAINLRLPRRELNPKARPSAHLYYEYGGQLAYLAKDGSDRPHAVCLMLDSGCKDADGLLLRSEVDAAICMSQLQLRDGHFTNHHTKPILITTILRKQAAAALDGQTKYPEATGSVDGYHDEKPSLAPCMIVSDSPRCSSLTSLARNELQ